MLQRICNGPGGEIRARPVANRGVAFWVGGRAGCIDNSDDAYIRFERLCVPFEAQKSVTEQEYVPGGARQRPRGTKSTSGRVLFSRNDDWRATRRVIVGRVTGPGRHAIVAGGARLISRRGRVKSFRGGAQSHQRVSCATRSRPASGASRVRRVAGGSRVVIPGEVGEGRSSRDFYMLQERSIALLFHVASLGSRREPPAVPERFQ